MAAAAAASVPYHTNTFQQHPAHKNAPNDSYSYSSILQYCCLRFSAMGLILERRSSYAAGSFDHEMPTTAIVDIDIMGVLWGREGEISGADWWDH